MTGTSKRPPSDASKLITKQIAELGDWRGEMFEQLRKLILEASPGITEAWKWGTAVWEEQGLVCAVGAFKNHVKINFFKGASLEDPKGVFNAGLDAKTMRSIDLRKGDKIATAAIKAMVRQAVSYNRSVTKKTSST